MLRALQKSQVGNRRRQSKVKLKKNRKSEAAVNQSSSNRKAKVEEGSTVCCAPSKFKSKIKSRRRQYGLLRAHQKSKTAVRLAARPPMLKTTGTSGPREHPQGPVPCSPLESAPQVDQTVRICRERAASRSHCEDCFRERAASRSNCEDFFDQPCSII